MGGGGGMRLSGRCEETTDRAEFLEGCPRRPSFRRKVD